MTPMLCTVPCELLRDHLPTSEQSSPDTPGSCSGMRGHVPFGVRVPLEPPAPPVAPPNPPIPVVLPPPAPVVVLPPPNPPVPVDPVPEPPLPLGQSGKSQWQPLGPS